MVKIDNYSEEFCNEFYRCVEEHLLVENEQIKDPMSRKRDKIDRTQNLKQKIVNYTNVLFARAISDFRELILMPYEELEKNYLYMKVNIAKTQNIFSLYKSDFDEMVNAYKRVVGSKSKKYK